MTTNTSIVDSKGMDSSDISTNLLMHHLDSFMHLDLNALVSDYTEESVFITQEATYCGKNEIREFFTNLLVHFPKEQC